MTETKSRKYYLLLLIIISGLVIGAAGIYTYSRVNTGNAGGEYITQADAAVAAAGMSAKDRKATEAVVRAYILDHPEIIPEAVAILQSREMATRLDTLGPGLYAPFAGDFAGNPAGDVTVVEFTDYNCGFCRSTVADVTKLTSADKNIRLVYRELPILAPSSKEAALWALAAADQGKHDAFHQAMFAAGHPDSASIRKVAASIGLDMAAAEKFVASPAASGEIEANSKFARAIGFNGTPTFIIGNQILEGAQGFQPLKDAVDKVRKSKTAE